MATYDEYKALLQQNQDQAMRDPSHPLNEIASGKAQVLGVNTKNIKNEVNNLANDIYQEIDGLRKNAPKVPTADSYTEREIAYTINTQRRLVDQMRANNNTPNNGQQMRNPKTGRILTPAEQQIMKLSMREGLYKPSENSEAAVLSRPPRENAQALAKPPAETKQVPQQQAPVPNKPREKSLVEILSSPPEEENVSEVVEII